jgi:hypothetical protein
MAGSGLVAVKHGAVKASSSLKTTQYLENYIKKS